MLDQNAIYNALEECVGTVEGGRRSLGDAMQKFVDVARQSESNFNKLMGKMHEPSSGASAYNGGAFDYYLGAIFQANLIARTIRDFYPDEDGLNILDFGAGSGRILRFMNRFFSPHNYYACEVNPHSVDFIRSAFLGVEADLINPFPPTDYDDEKFDVVYAWSIWSHYNADVALNWLNEMYRIIKPGGCALITVHNEEIVKRYGEEPKLKTKLEERGGDYNAIKEEYERTGFSYWSAYREDAKSYGFDIDTFGMAFVSREYIQNKWTQNLKLVGFKDAVPGWQDLCVLQKM